MDIQEKTAEIELEEKESWGKLSSLNESKYPTIQLCDDVISLGRNDDNVISIPDSRLSGVHLIIQEKSNKYYITDKSTNGTFIEDEKVGRNNEKEIKSGDTIYILHKSKVQADQVRGYIFCVGKNVERKKQNGDNTVSSKQLQNSDLKKQKLEDDLDEEMKCLICLDYIYQCVTLLDCLHNFCGSCYSDIMLKSDKCPHCREKVKAVKKNANVNNIISQYLEVHPNKKRTKEEYDQMNKNNRITIETVYMDKIKKKGGTDKQEDSDLSFNDSDEEQKVSQVQIQPQQQQRRPPQQPAAQNRQQPQNKGCIECQNPRESDGFQCAPNQAHYVCINCLKKFPNRGGANYKQKCEICNATYCNLYFACTGTKQNKLVQLKDAQPPQRLRDNIFNNNKYEFNVLLDFIKEKKYSTKDMYKYMIDQVLDQNKFKYKANKSMIPLFNSQYNMELLMTGDSAVCINCFDLVWFQIVFHYRNLMLPQFPAPVKGRKKCWYGINCSTMQHNESHSKNLDHICEQTKFS